MKNIIELIPSSIGTGKVDKCNIFSENNNWVLKIGPIIIKDKDINDLIKKSNIEIFKMYANVGISGCKKYDKSYEYEKLDLSNYPKRKIINGENCYLNISKEYFPNKNSNGEILFEKKMIISYFGEDNIRKEYYLFDI